MNNVNTKLITSVIFTIIFSVFVVYILFHQHLRISDNTTSWGTFGDYIGGILNPTIAFFAFYLIAKTYDLQKQELEATRELLKISTDAQIKQVNLAALTALLNSKLMQIDRLNLDLDSINKSVTEGINKGVATPESTQKDITDKDKKLEELQKNIGNLENKINSLLIN